LGPVSTRTPKNPAVKVWPRLEFATCGIHPDFKGPGKHRAIFEKL
jgi:hypothetical protein